jgi:hypothetical protein
MSTNNQTTEINSYYRPIVVSNGRQRALKDRDIDTVAENALIEALQAEKPGTEGYILKVFKVEVKKEVKS